MTNNQLDPVMNWVQSVIYQDAVTRPLIWKICEERVAEVVAAEVAAGLDLSQSGARREQLTLEYALGQVERFAFNEGITREGWEQLKSMALGDGITRKTIDNLRLRATLLFEPYPDDVDGEA